MSPTKPSSMLLRYERERRSRLQINPPILAIPLSYSVRMYSLQIQSAGTFRSFFGDLRVVASAEPALA